MISQELIDMMCCPVCRGGLSYLKESSKILCESCGRAYPVRDGIPVMLEDEAEPGDAPKTSGN